MEGAKATAEPTRAETIASFIMVEFKFWLWLRQNYDGKGGGLRGVVCL